MSALTFRAAPMPIALPRISTLGERIFAVAAVVVWIHLIDASVIHPQAGAGLGEHALQALLALSVPPFAAWLYVHLRSWGRAALAITSAMATLPAGVVIHIIGPIKNGRMHADDYTGIAMAVAGLVLLVLGAVMLVTSVPRVRYRIALAPAFALGFFWVVLPPRLSVYMAHAPRYEIGDFEMGAPHEDVAFETADGLTIRGSYVPPRNGAVVIVTHGSGGARIRPQSHIEMLVRAGYGVLAIDSRGHGESEGTTNALGWGAYHDIEAATAYLANRDEVDPARIGILGLSMGAEIALDAATHGAPLAAVVADGAGGRSINEVLSLKRRWSDALTLPTVAMVNLSTAVLTGTLPPSSLESRIDNVTAPTFFISSAKIGEERDLNRIWYRKATATKSSWEVDAGHTAGLKTYPEEYQRRVLAFFGEHLGVE